MMMISASSGVACLRRAVYQNVLENAKERPFFFKDKKKKRMIIGFLNKMFVLFWIGYGQRTRRPLHPGRRKESSAAPQPTVFPPSFRHWANHHAPVPSSLSFLASPAGYPFTYPPSLVTPFRNIGRPHAIRLCW